MGMAIEKIIGLHRLGSLLLCLHTPTVSAGLTAAAVWHLFVKRVLNSLHLIDSCSR